MIDFLSVYENLDPEARKCVEEILKRMTMAKTRRHTGAVSIEFNFGQGALFDSHWKEQLAGKRKRVVRSSGI